VHQVSLFPGMGSPRYYGREKPRWRGHATRAANLSKQADMITIPLHSRKYPGLMALADDEDAELLAQYRWYPLVDRAGNQVRIYAIADVGRKPHRTIKMHTLITGYTQTDHRDCDGLNNKRSNLRDASGSQNQANARARGGTSRYKGVSWAKGPQRWRAGIKVNQRGHCLGFFDSEPEAAHAYDQAALAAWGEFARLNFPD
jgi:hypothetical protein